MGECTLRPADDDGTEGRLTHHVELILFPGVNNRLRESSINETLSKITSQKD